MADKIPLRCRDCANWMGQYSGDEDDTRCNRNWGWKPQHGKFSGIDEAGQFGQPAEVEFDCTVPKYPGSEKQIDAFIPKRPERVEVVDGGQRAALNADELRIYINSSMSTDNPFEELEESRRETAERNQQLHEDRMNVAGEMGTANDLPKWTRGEERVPTGFPQLDWALGGGFCPGIKFKHWGSYQTWKSTLTYSIIGAHQTYRDKMIEENFERIADFHGFDPTPDALEATIQNQKVLALAGEDFDPSWAAKQGVDTSRMQMYDMEYMEDALQQVVEDMQEDLDRIESNFNPELASWMRVINYFHIMIDSLDSFKLWADEHGAKDKKNVLQDDARMASRASLLSDFFRVFSDAPKVPITWEAIAQQRINMGAGMAYASGKKGNAEAHNTRISIRHRTDKPSDDGEQILTLEFYQTQHPGINIQERESIELVATVGEGLLPEPNTVKAAIDNGIIDKRGAWLDYVPEDGSENDNINQHGIDYMQFADKLKNKGVYDEVYDRCYDAMS